METPILEDVEEHVRRSGTSFGGIPSSRAVVIKGSARGDVTPVTLVVKGIHPPHGSKSPRKYAWEDQGTYGP